MNNLIKESLAKLKQKNISNPELDLRILLKYASKKNNEIILSNLNIFLKNLITKLKIVFFDISFNKNFHVL